MEQFVTALDWLQQRALTGRGGAQYIYAYAFDLWQTGQPTHKESAALMWLYGKLTIRVDAARCADQRAPETKMMKWESQLTNIQDYYQQLDAEQKAKLANLALQFEEKNSDRKHDAWLCSGGLSFMKRYFEKHGDASSSKEAIDPLSGEKVTVLKDDEIRPEFISDADWQQKRAEVIGGFKKQFLQ